MATEQPKPAGDPWAPQDGRAGESGASQTDLPGALQTTGSASQAPQPARSSTGSGRQTRRTRSGKSARAVTVTAIDIPFWSLVRFGLKLVLASVPALLVLLALLVAIVSLAGALLGTAIMAAASEWLTGLAQSAYWPW